MKKYTSTLLGAEDGLDARGKTGVQAEHEGMFVRRGDKSKRLFAGGERGFGGTGEKSRRFSHCAFGAGNRGAWC